MFAAFQCSNPGSLWYLPNMPTTKLISGLVHVYILKHATNPASIVDEAVIDYFSLFHEIAPFASIKTNPEVDFKLSIQPP